MFKGEEVPRIETPRQCPKCRKQDQLKRNGTYSRNVVDEEEVEYLVDITRLRCRSCGASYSLLYEFLVPYRKYTARALGKVVTEYLSKPSTYLEAAAAGVRESATVFDAVQCVLAQLPIIWMFLMRTLTDAGIAVPRKARTKSCPNTFKCKTEEKKEQLNFAAQVLELIPEALELAARGGYSVYAGRRGCELLRTHSSECKLF